MAKTKVTASRQTNLKYQGGNGGWPGGDLYDIIKLAKVIIDRDRIPAFQGYASAGRVAAGGKSALPIDFRPIDWHIHGGLMANHVHLDGQIYPFNEKQWTEFSEKVVENARVKVGAARKISFEQAVAVAQAMG